MSEVMTKEALVEAFQKSKAVTISGVWRYLGHKSAISGSQSKRIKELVPNYMSLLEDSKNGITVQSEKIPVAVQEVKTTTESVVAEVAAPKKTYYVKKAKGAGGIRAGSCLEILFREGSKDFIALDELLEKVAKIKGKSKAKVKNDFTSMNYPNHTNNRGRADVVEKDGKIKIIVPVK